MPQKRFPVEAKIGLFVVVALIALVIVTTQVNQSGLSFRSMKTYFLQFQNVSGLLESAPVEYAGLRVGRVDSFQLDEKSGAILVKIKVEKNFSLYEDSIVELITRGLLGEKIIMIQGGGKAPVIPEGGVIKAFRSSSGLEEAMQSFNDISSDIKNLLRGGGGRASVQDIIENLNETSENIRAVVNGRRDDLDEIVGNMAAVSRALKEFLAKDENRIQDSLQKFSSAMAKIEETATKLNDIISRTERGEGTVGKLLTDETTVNKLNTALDGVTEFVGQVKQLEIGLGFRGEYMANSKEMLAVTSFMFRPAFDKYFLLEFSDGSIAFAPRETKVKVIETTPGSTVTEKTTTTKDSLSITAIFARRFWDFTLKAGLIRSTGGLGADFHLFRDHLTLAAEAFDFSRDSKFQLRLLARLHFLNIFYASGGVDDIFGGSNGRNYFGSLGFMVTDDDIKRLFGLATLAR